MKDRVREAIFNLLGPRVVGRHALDAFAGTGALGLEAVSRGAARATLIERHFPTAAVIRRNAASLGIESQCEVIAADAFYWVAQRWRSQEPIVAFISPPYDFYVDRRDEMLGLIARLCAQSPPESVVIVEADERFDFRLLPSTNAWQVRAYSPAVIALAEVPQ